MALATALAWAAVSDWPPSTETPPLADAMPEATTLLIVRPEGHVLAGFRASIEETVLYDTVYYPATSSEFLYEVVFFCWFL